MKKSIFLIFVSCSCCASVAYSGQSPMVERHIFSPEPDEKASYKSPTALKLERELMFTGVVKSPQGKWAIIRPREKSRAEEYSGLRKVGDEINGMVIKEIGSNYLILAGSGKEVRLNLYHEGKSRPEVPRDNGPIAGFDEKNTPSTFRDRSKFEPVSSGAQPADHFNQTSGSPAEGRQEKSRASTSGPSPFDVDRPPNDFPPAPFPQEMPPNPFMQGQDMPPDPLIETPPDPLGE